MDEEVVEARQGGNQRVTRHRYASSGVVVCLLISALPALGAQNVRHNFDETAFWKNMGRPTNVTSTTTFKGDYMEYLSSGSILFLKDHASIQDSNSDLKADQIKIFLNEKRTEAKGKVHLVMPSGNKIQSSTMTIIADEMTVYNVEKRALGIGHVQITDATQLIRGSRINFNWVRSTGTIDDAVGFDPPWRIAARHVKQTGPKTYILTGNASTSCDLETPHYFFRSSYARYTRGVRITGLNNVLWVDGLPTVWTPFFTHPIGEQTIIIQVKPGQTKRDGTVIKSNLYYGFARNAYVRVIGDYYYKTGIGQGLETGYFSSKVKGTVYAYHIDDSNPDLLQPTDRPGTPFDKERYKAYVAHWQQLAPHLTMQANINYLSDPNFNNLFVPQHFEPVVNTAIGALSQLAFTHQLPWAITTLSSVRTDTFDPAHNNQFFNKDWVLPSLSFTTIPLKSKHLPFYTQIRASYINDIQTENSVVSASTSTQTGNAQVNLSKGIPLTRSMTLTPSVGLQESYITTDPNVIKNPSILISRASENTNIHDRLTRWLDLDFSHSITMRSVQNKFVQDANAVDHGVEAHNLNISFFSAPRPGAWIRVAGGYNLRVVDKNGILNGTSGDYTGPPEQSLMGTIQQRMNSPNFEFNIKPRNDIEFYIRELYHLAPSLHNGVTQARTTWRPDVKTFFQGSAAYNNGSPGQLQLDTTAGFNFSPGWRVQTTLEYFVTGAGGIDYRTIAPAQRELKIIRRLHCWKFSVDIIDRPGVRQVLFGIQLVTDILAQKSVASMEEEEQLYPWRQPWKE